MAKFEMPEIPAFLDRRPKAVGLVAKLSEEQIKQAVEYIGDVTIKDAKKKVKKNAKK